MAFRLEKSREPHGAGFLGQAAAFQPCITKAMQSLKCNYSIQIQKCFSDSKWKLNVDLKYINTRIHSSRDMFFGMMHHDSCLLIQSTSPEFGSYHEITSYLTKIVWRIKFDGGMILLCFKKNNNFRIWDQPLACIRRRSKYFCIPIQFKKNILLLNFWVQLAVTPSLHSHTQQGRDMNEWVWCLRTWLFCAESWPRRRGFLMQHQSGTLEIRFRVLWRHRGEAQPMCGRLSPRCGSHRFEWPVLHVFGLITHFSVRPLSK